MYQIRLFLSIHRSIKNMTNISKHPCANKCSEFKEEQCKTCLIIGDDQFIENHISPSCRNISNDEHIHLSNALAAQKEIS